MRLNRITTSTELPVKLLEVKRNSRIESTDEDEETNEILKDVIEDVQRSTERALLEEVWQLKLDRFPNEPVELRLLPVLSVESITYLDSSGEVATLPDTDYVIDNHSPNRPARIVPASGQCWPTTFCQIGAVTIEFKAGYAPGNVPRAALRAIKMLFDHWYHHRDIDTEHKTYPRTQAYDCLISKLRWNLL